MQRCPKCNRTYQDASQKFCTFDGGRLMVDAEAPTTFDLGPMPQTDPLGATVTGSAPDLNKTVAGTPPPLTSEIPPPAQTGPTHPPAQPWQGAPHSSMPPPPTPPAQTGPTTTSPLAARSAEASQPPIASSGGLAQTTATTGSQTGPVAGAPQSGALGAQVAAAAAARPKSSRMLFLVGGLAVFFLLLIAGGAGYYFLAMKPQATASNSNSGSAPSLETDSGARNTNSNSSAGSGNANAASAASQPPVTPPPDSTRFLNSRDKLTGSLSEHFVDFSLYYPNNWILDPKAGTSGSSNFFRASRYFQDKSDSYVLENMTVGWYQSNGTMQLDRPIFPNRVEYFNNLLQKDFPEYQKISEGETTVNGLQGYQFTFKSTVRETTTGDVNFWGRVIFLPVGSESAKNGVVLMMVSSSDLPEIKGIADVGEKGELPTILKTFRFGESQ